MITDTTPISTGIVKLCDERGHRFEFDGTLMETKTATWSEFPNRRKAILEQILVSEERYKSKRAGLRVAVRDPSRKVNHLSKVIWDYIL